MAFHENSVFPANISRGSRGGWSFGSGVFELDSGALSVVQRWGKARRQYDVRYGIRKFQDLHAVRDFYLGREGSANGFRYFDWFDHSTAPDHTDAPEEWNSILGQGDGTTLIFQLVKHYQSGAQTVTRSIEKPIQGTVTVSLSGNTQTEGVDYTVDYSTGQILFASAPAGNPNADSVSAGCEYHVPVQFAPESDALLEIGLETFEAGEMPDINLVEMIGNVVTPEQPWRGASSYQILNTHSLYDFGWGHTVAFLPNSDNLIVTLPDITDLNDGAPIFHFLNVDTSNSIQFRHRVSGALEFTVGPTQGAVVCVVNVNGTNTWRALVGV